MADTVRLRGSGGAEFTFDLPLPQAIQDQLGKGELVVVEDKAVPAVSQVPQPEYPARPKNGAPKSAWVAYAVSKGATVEEAEGATKDQLVEVYGATAPAAGSTEG